MNFISIKDKTPELLLALKEHYGTDASMHQITGADLYYSDGDAAIYEFKVVHKSNYAFIGNCGVLITEKEEPFKLIIKKWFDKYIHLCKQ